MAASVGTRRFVAYALALVAFVLLASSFPVALFSLRVAGIFVGVGVVIELLTRHWQRRVFEGTKPS